MWGRVHDFYFIIFFSFLGELHIAFKENWLNDLVTVQATGQKYLLITFEQFGLKLNHLALSFLEPFYHSWFSCKLFNTLGYQNKIFYHKLKIIIIIKNLTMVKITNCMSWSYLSSFGPKPSGDNQVCCCSYRFIPVLSMFGSLCFRACWIKATQWRVSIQKKILRLSVQLLRSRRSSLVIGRWL